MSREPGLTLAEALASAKKAARDNIVQHSNIDRKHLDLLVQNKWLTQIIRGWYLLSTPEADGNSTAWYGGFWAFLQHYLLDRFEKQGYCLSAEASLDLWVDESQIPTQIAVITKKASNQTIQLPHDTSVVLYSDQTNFPSEVTKKKGIYAMPLAVALSRLTPPYFNNKPLNVELGLKLLPSVNDLSRVLLENKMGTAAGRLSGALKVSGDEKGAEQILKDFEAAGIHIQVVNPFEAHVPQLGKYKRITSPYVGRIEAKWDSMRKEVIKIFPEAPGLTAESEKKTIQVILDLYKHDAYNSLSIEGYEVTEELIQKIASGKWDPDFDPKDKEQRDALAAKGYYDAFQVIIESIKRILHGKNSGEVFEGDLQSWYRALFSPSVAANIIKPSDLAGYRNHPVYIKGARHVPPSKEAVPEAMETLFKRLKDEPEASVRAVLGHFIFVYIHPYMDGNGRIGRFLFNLMLVSGGYPWTVIRTSERSRYMEALESASSENDIVPFAEFVKSEMGYWVSKNR